MPFFRFYTNFRGIVTEFCNLAQIKANHVPKNVRNFGGDRLIVSRYIVMNVGGCFFFKTRYKHMRFFAREIIEIIEIIDLFQHNRSG